MDGNSKLDVASRITGYVNGVRNRAPIVERIAVGVEETDAAPQAGTFVYDGRIRQILVAPEGLIATIGECILCCRNLVNRVTTSIDKLENLYRIFVQKTEELAEISSQMAGGFGEDLCDRIGRIVNCTSRLSCDIPGAIDVLLFSVAPEINDLLGLIESLDDAPAPYSPLANASATLNELKAIAESIAKTANEISIAYEKIAS